MMRRRRLKWTKIWETPARDPFVHANYETVSTLKDLDRWIAAATDLGVVAVDTETDSLDSM